MKYLLLFMLLGYGGLWAQHIEGGYLKSCDNLKSSEAKIVCTDSTLLEDIRIGWSKIKNEIEPGTYHVTYVIFSTGDNMAEKIILIPQRIVFNSKPELLLELADKSVKQREWVLPKSDYFEKGNKKMKVGIQRNLKINTTQL